MTTETERILRLDRLRAFEESLLASLADYATERKRVVQDLENQVVTLQVQLRQEKEKDVT